MVIRKICLTLALALLLSGCAAGNTAPSTAAPSAETVETTQPATAAPTVPETLPPETTPPTEETLPPSPYHSGIRADGTFGEGALFIGDSLTFGLVKYYLKDNGLLGDARYMAISGATLMAFHKGPRLGDGYAACAYSPEYEKLKMSEAITLEGEKTTAIYIMLGTNYSKYADDDTYIQIVTDLLDSCPNATVYLQLVPNDESKRVNSPAANARVRRVYEHFAAEADSRVLLIDTNAAIGRCLAADGIHLTAEGQENWYNCLLAFAADNGIPE